MFFKNIYFEFFIIKKYIYTQIGLCDGEIVNPIAIDDKESQNKHDIKKRDTESTDDEEEDNDDKMKSIDIKVII